MSGNELYKAVQFGLENLDTIYRRLLNFSQKDIEEEIKTSALTYECQGYYHAVEHLAIRVLKHQKAEIPTGPFSHRDTLKAFEAVLANSAIQVEPGAIETIEDLMAFRHVATKIYGFLINNAKLQAIIDKVVENHANIKQLFENVAAAFDK